MTSNDGVPFNGTVVVDLGNGTTINVDVVDGKGSFEILVSRYTGRVLERNFPCHYFWD